VPALAVLTFRMVPGAASSGIIAGTIRDMTGSYYGAILTAVLYAVAFLLSICMTQPTKHVVRDEDDRILRIYNLKEDDLSDDEIPMYSKEQLQNVVQEVKNEQYVAQEVKYDHNEEKENEIL